MDKIKKYQDILIHYLSDFAREAHLANMPEVETRILADREHNSFQALHVGWQGAQFIFSPIFHFDIKDGKVWLQCNNTEREVVDVLMHMGIAKSDIVLGFQPPFARAYSGFSVA